MVMQHTGLCYPKQWPVMYKGKDGKLHPCVVVDAHRDVPGQPPYYTIMLLSRDNDTERQNTADRLSSWVDKISYDDARRTFETFVTDCLPPKYGHKHDAILKNPNLTNN